MDERVWKHTPEMGEISGFGGGYEEACQQMLHQGVAYLVSLGERRPEFEVETYRGVFGICDLTGPDAEGLEAAVMMSNYMLKVGWEVVNTPFTYRVVNFLKRVEHEDYYDRHTNFTPFSLEA